MAAKDRNSMPAFGLAVYLAAASLGTALIGVAVATVAADAASARAVALATQPELAASQWRSALGWRPDVAANHRGLASALQDSQLDRARSEAMQATRLDPGDWQNWNALAMLDVQLGNVPAARAALRRGSAVDQGYQAHAAAAGLAILAGDNAAAWRELAIAWRMVPSQDAARLMADSLRAPGESWDHLRAMVPDDPAIRAGALAPLLAVGAYDHAVQLWSGSGCQAGAREVCRGAVMTLVAELTKRALLQPEPGSAALIAGATTAFRTGVEQGYLPAPAPLAGRSTDPNLGAPGLETFELPWIGPRWSWASTTDAQLLPAAGNGVEVILTGYQPDTALLGTQVVEVCAGCSYALELAVHGQAGAEAAIMATAQDGASALAQAQGPEARQLFTAARTGPLVLDLLYRRPQGSPPVRGSLFIAQVALEPSR